MVGERVGEGRGEFCEFYLQELYQVLTAEDRGKKSPGASCKGRGKVTILN